MNWMRFTHSKEGICFTQSINSKINLIKKHPSRHTRNNVQPNILALCDTVKLTHKMNHSTVTSHLTRMNNSMENKYLALDIIALGRQGQ